MQVYTQDFFFEQSKPLISQALSEDLGCRGDISTQYCLLDNPQSEAVLYARQDGIIAGVQLATYAYRLGQDKDSVCIENFKKDGDFVACDDKIMRVRAGAKLLLERERTVLNFMQRMSGIATHTQRLVSKISSYHTRLLDTRKTAPCLRSVDKWAVLIGGGENHRFGLYDAIMLKENHIDYAGGIQSALKNLQQRLGSKGKKYSVIVEARGFSEFLHIKHLGVGLVDRILLDNFSPKEVALAVEENKGQFQLEASGGITEENISTYAQAGPDFISMGYLTHTVQAFDMSILVQ